MPRKHPQAIANSAEILAMTLPWKSTSFGNEAEIEVFFEHTGTWEVIATISPVAGIDAEDVANFIVDKMSRHLQNNH